MTFLNNSIHAALKTIRYVAQPKSARSILRMPVELSKEERDIIGHVKDHDLSMVSEERLWTTLMTCKHAVEQGIEGDFVECGVWRGGNALIAAKIFQMYGVNKKVYLFDTYEGMTTPTEKDKRASDGVLAIDKFRAKQAATHNEWCYASLEDVQRNFEEYGVRGENTIFVKGDVRQTLLESSNVPEKICVLRLDTDWYESTKVELEVLYPRLSLGGALMLDDYGHWAGAREATDEYFELNRNRPYFQYIDYAGRVAVKAR